MRISSEACLKLENAEAAAKQASVGLEPHCKSHSKRGTDYVFDFDSATALVRPEPKVLWIRVEANDLAICDGVKMLIEAEIMRYAKSMPPFLLWLKAESEPFVTILAFEKAGGITAR